MAMARPVNYRTQDASGLAEDVAYAVNSYNVYETILQAMDLPPERARILELGPGKNFGAQALLVARGARVTLADRYLARWDGAYHPAFYRALADHGRVVPAPNIEAMIAGGGHEVGGFILLEEPAEDLRSAPDGSIDLVFSNAVLEHVRDIRAVARETARVLRPGGRAVHQIDMRYHGDFTRPLDHLLWSEPHFYLRARRCHFECGNRLRPSEFEAAFAEAGLALIDREANDFADPAYVANVVKRLRRGFSRYRAWPEADLHVVGARFTLEKRA